MPYYRSRYSRSKYHRRESRRKENNASGFLSNFGSRAGTLAADRLLSERTFEKVLPWIQSGLAAIPPIAGLPVGQAASIATGLVHSGYHWFADDDGEGDSSERRRDSFADYEYSDLDRYSE